MVEKRSDQCAPNLLITRPASLSCRMATITSRSPVISFPVGYHEPHPDISVNFQKNRFYGWVGDESMLTEMRGKVINFAQAHIEI